MQFVESRNRQMNSECGFKCSRVIFLAVKPECERLRVLWGCCRSKAINLRKGLSTEHCLPCLILTTAILPFSLLGRMKFYSKNENC
jgi:hypothetical protein